MNLAQTAERIGELAAKVGTYIASEQSKLAEIEVETKSLNSLVSYVDKTAEKQIVEGLKALVPEAGFIAEEGTEKPNDSEYQWIVDPLDGTTNFLHGLPIYSVSIALTQKVNDRFEPVIGVIYEAGQDELFIASQGNGATLNGKTISVTKTPKLQDTLLATGFPYYDFGKMNEYLQLLAHLFENTRGLRRLGSAATDLAYVACGRFDGFFEYGLSPWDVAAGVLIVREAGGQVREFSGGNDPIFGKTIWASNPQIADAVDFSELA